MKKQMSHRVLGVLLTCALLLGLLPAIELPALAANSGEKGTNVSSLDEATLRRLGLMVDEESLAEAAAAAQAPAGTATFSVYTINELMVGTSSGEYFNDLPDAANTIGGKWNVLPSSIWQNGTSAGSPDTTKDTMMRSAAMQLTDNGKKDHVAQLVAEPNEDGGTTISIQILNGADKELLPLDNQGSTRLTLSKLNFALYPPHASAFLAIATGDFDGDKQDEIAVYVPSTSWDENAYPEIRIYKYDSEKKILDRVGKTITINYSTAGYLYEDDFSTPKKRLSRMYPAVSLAAVENTDNGIDDLAVGVSHMRHGNDDLKSSHQLSSVVFWKDPGTKDSSSRWEYLSNSWADYGKSPASSYESMIFPGVASGDVDGDGRPDVVVAGYRIDGASNGKATWSMDRGRYLITYYSLAEQVDGSFRYEKQMPMEWISIKSGDYGGALEMDSGFLNINDAENRVVNPLSVAVYAERGTGYNKSIFVNGFVVNLPTISKDGEGVADQLEMELGKPAYAMHPFGSLSHYIPNDLTKSFRIRYAAPLRGVDTEMTSGSISAMRNVLEVAVGNFDGNGMGREQVMFSYIVRHQGEGQAAGLPFSTFLCGMSFRGSGGDMVENQKWNKNGWKDNAKGVVFDAVRVSSSNRNTVLTVCAPDVDNDSVLMRYANKPADYYFSDPQIIAVMQAAPYFADLSEELGSDPETAFAKTGGTSTSQDQAVTVHGSFGLGLSGELPVSVGFIANIGIEAVEAEIMFSVSGEAGWAFNRESAREVSTSFSAGYDDTVALTMTPTVRHYYEMFDPKSGWKEVFIDVPETPKTSQVSVDLYDEVASVQDWTTLRESVLRSSMAGYPSTYRPTPPTGVQWAGTERDDSGAVGEFLKVGTGGGAVSKSVSKSLAHANGVTWGTGVEVNAGLKVIAVKAEAGAGMDYTGGFSWSTFTGTEFSGTVPDIAGHRAGDYSFEWAFGSYTASMPNNPDREFVVLNYLVKNVRSLPLAPLDAEVQEVTADSVTLRWSDELNTSPLTYEVYRVLGNNYYPLGTVQANEGREYTFTDTQCDPNTEYTYVVRTYAYANGVLRSSNYSAPVSAITRLLDGATVTGPGNATANSGESAVFAVYLQGGSRPAYQWQYRPGAGGWTDLAGKNQPQLTVNNITPSMDGYQYRCVVMPFVGNVIETIYSDAGTLRVDRRGSETVLALTDEAGKTINRGDIREEVLDTSSSGSKVVTYPVPFQVVPPGGSYESRVPVLQSDTGENAVYYLRIEDAYYIPAGGDQEKIKLGIEYSGLHPNQWDPYTALSEAPAQIHIEQFFYTDAEKAEEQRYTAFDGAILWGTPTSGEGELTFQEGLTTADYATYTDGTNTLYEVVKTEITTQDGDEVVTTDILYFVGAGESGYTQLYLGEAIYYTGENTETGTILADFDPDALTLAMGMVRKSFGKYITVKGTEVSMTANVRPTEGGGTATGSVVFSILNTTNGTRFNVARQLEGGTAVYQWTATEAGAYVITASYGGSGLLEDSKSAAATYTAASQSQWLVADCVGSATYGDPAIPIRFKLYTATADGLGASEVPAKDCSYREISGASRDDYQITLTGDGRAWNLTFKKPGTYTFQFTYTTFTATKTITVSRLPLTVAAADLSYKVGDEGLAGVTGMENLHIEGLLETDTEALGDIFYLGLDLPTGIFTPEELPIGAYPIRVLVKDNEADKDYQALYAALREKYDFTEQNGTLTVTNDKYKVGFSHDVNGSLAVSVDGTAPLSSGDEVYKGSSIVFNATPDRGFTPSQWTVNETPVAADDPNLSADGRLYTIPALSGEAEVAVEFAPTQWSVTFGVQADSEEWGSLAAETAAGAASSPIRLAGNAWIAFTATPGEGYTIANWYVDGVAQNTYGRTFRVDALEKDLLVEVAFQKEESYTVTVSSSGPGTVELYDGDGNALGASTKVPVHGTVTAKAVPIGGASVTKWIATGASDQGASDTYVLENVTRDVELTAVFTPIASYAVSYALEGGKGGETIGAEALGQKVDNGSAVASGAEVMFTVTGLGEHRQVSRWEVNGQAVSGASGASFACRVTGRMDVKAYVTDINTYTVSYSVAETPTVGDGYNGTLSASYTTPRDGGPAGSNEPARSGSFEDVEEFAQVTLIAAPEFGYRVKKWTVGGQDWKQQDETAYRGKVLELVVQSEELSVMVEFERDNNNLTFAAAGPGALTAAMEGLPEPIGSGIRLENGAQVTFTATAEEGYELTGWKLDGSLLLDGEGNPITDTAYLHTMDGSAHVEAVFQGEYVTVEVTATQGGSAAMTSPADADGGRVRRGTEVQIRAVPEPGCQLTGWSVGEDALDGADNPLKLTVDGDVSVNAVFAPIPYTLHYEVKGGSGTLEATVGGVSAESGREYNGGQEVLLTASPEPGFRAVWTQDGAPVAGAGNVLSFPLTKDTAVSVIFEAIPTRSLTVTAGAGGTYEVTANGEALAGEKGVYTVGEGDVITVTAKPDPYYRVFAWIVDGVADPALGGRAAYSYTVGADDCKVELSFRSMGSYDVNYAVVDETGTSAVEGYLVAADGAETPIGSGPARPMGSRLVFKVTPGAGRMVDHWLVNGERVSSEYGTDYIWDEYALTLTSGLDVEVHMTAAAFHTVTFSADPAAGGKVTATVNGKPIQSGGSVRAGATVLFQASANSGYSFASFQSVQGEAVSGGGWVIPALSANAEVTASFSQYTPPPIPSGGGTPEVKPDTTITEKEGDKLIQDAVDNEKDTIIIDAETPTVSLPAGFLSGAGSKTDADILISTPVAAILLPNGALGNLASLGGELTVRATLDKKEDGTHLLTLDITSDGKAVGRVPGGVRVTVPFTGGGNNTVAVLQSGGGKVLPKSIAMGGKMTVPMDGPAAALLIENPKAFPDTEGHWAKEYIDFVTSHELYQGVGGGRFLAEGDMTRAMLWTVLARLESVDTTGGGWYEKSMEWVKETGISDGNNPEESITREQLVTMLWRYAGHMGYDTGVGEDTNILSYTDAGEVAEYAIPAFQWACGEGIVNGKDGNRLDPKGSASRAEVAAVILRFIQKL